MKTKLDLKKIFKQRNIKLSDCQTSTEELNDFITLDLIAETGENAHAVLRAWKALTAAKEISHPFIFSLNER